MFSYRGLGGGGGWGLGARQSTKRFFRVSILENSCNDKLSLGRKSLYLERTAIHLEMARYSEWELLCISAILLSG